jgi:osmotically-inducible protein OsmY
MMAEKKNGMVIKQAAQTNLDERNRCRDQAWLTPDRQTRNESTGPAENDVVSVQSKNSQTRFEEWIQVGQKVFSTGDQSIGRIIKLIPDAEGKVSHLILRAAHFRSRHKIIPVEKVCDANTQGVWLSIDPRELGELPDDKSDASINNEVELALWNDEILRVTDYREIDIRVKNGVVTLGGHISGMMNLARIERAIEKVTGILGVRNHLVTDDGLLLKVAEALAPVQRAEGNRIFTKVEYGVVGLSGKVINADVRDLAERCAASVPQVRGVINNIVAPGIDLQAENQQFFQPSIGERIYFRDNFSGIVRQVIINRNNRCVVAMVLEGQFPDRQQEPKSGPIGETLMSERQAVVPVRFIRYLTRNSGYLLIDSTETNQYKDFDPAGFITPDADWAPPYPYCTENVRFIANA